jgi:hypothetical protein
MSRIYNGDVVEVFKFKSTGLGPLIVEANDYIGEMIGRHGMHWFWSVADKITYREDDYSYYFVFPSEPRN